MVAYPLGPLLNSQGILAMRPQTKHPGHLLLLTDRQLSSSLDPNLVTSNQPLSTRHSRVPTHRTNKTKEISNSNNSRCNKPVVTRHLWKVQAVCQRVSTKASSRSERYRPRFLSLRKYTSAEPTAFSAGQGFSLHEALAQERCLGLASLEQPVFDPFPICQNI